MSIQVPDPDAPELRSGDVLAGKYQLLAPLAEGGMGCIWTARNLATGATVAAKVLLPGHASSPGALARFRREAHAMASVAHRAIVRVFDLLELGGPSESLVLVMELLHGETLAVHIHRAGPLGLEEALQIVFPLLSALEHAHGLGIIHRDLKPENIFLASEPDGQRMPKLVDFGISKQLQDSPITLDGQIVGTMNYMSPEQTMGEQVDARSDVFSLGVVLYECLAGVNPFVQQLAGKMSPYNLLAVFAAEPPPLAGVLLAVQRVVRRAMATRPEDRFASVAEFSEALRSAAPFEARPADSRPSARIFPVGPEPVRATRSLRRRFAGAAIASLVAVALAIPAVASRSHAHEATHAEMRATSDQVVHSKRLLAPVDVLRAPDPESPPDDAVPRAPAHARRQSPFGVHDFWHLAPGRRPLAGARALLAARGSVRIVKDPGF